MSVLDLIQVMGFALTCLIAGYSLGKRYVNTIKDRPFEVSPKS